MLKTGYSNKNKFLSKNDEEAKRAVTRYSKERHTPGNAIQNVINRKASVKRPSKTAKYKQRNY